jgi:translation initiation factor IF-1
VSRQDAIEIEGTVVEVLREKLFRVEFSNGHRILAILPKRYRDSAGLELGRKVTVEMSPYDFSKGRISLKEKKN